MDTKLISYHNGNFIPFADTKIHVCDSALMFGDMVFEMTRSFNKRQFMLRQHLERLYTGIKILRIPLNMTIDKMEALCYETIERNEPAFRSDDEHRLMINVSRGPLSIYAPLFKHTEPTVIISDFPLGWTVKGMGTLFDTGVNAVIPSQRAIPAHLLDPRIKSRSRQHYQVANIEVRERDNTWALLLDDDGFITEGTGDNFFIVKNGIVYTPEGRNILRGISRQFVMDNIPQIDVMETNITPYDIDQADEAFFTATPFCIMPCTSFDRKPIGDGKVGKVTSRCIKYWGDNQGVDIIQQIKDWNKEDDSLASGPSPYQFK